MLKLLTLQSLSTFSTDAQYRLQSRMELYGLFEENVFVYEDTDSLVDAAVVAADEGFDLIVAVENEEYNSIKMRLMGRLMLEEFSSPVIAEAISIQLTTGYSAEPIDMYAQSAVPRDSVLFLSNDGLYSGFGVSSLTKGNRLFFVPLDYSRIDSVLDELVKSFYSAPDERTLPENKEIPEPDHEEPLYDFKPGLSQLVYSLVQSGKRIAFAQNDATEMLLPLIPEVAGFGDVAYFVENKGPDLNSEDTAQTKAVRIARDCVSRTFADFGVAVSDVVLAEEGMDNLYSVYIAIVDKDSAKVKKITTDNPEDTDLLFPHAISLVLEIMSQRLDELAKANLSATADVQEEPSDAQERDAVKQAPVKTSMVLVAVLVALVAIGSAIFFVASYVGGAETTEPSSTAVNLPFYSTTLPSSSNSTTLGGIAGITDTSSDSLTITGATTADPNYSTPAEPTASQIAASTTTAAVSSESGTFTFYVFGYGHGVGMSQRGADYYAKQGWNYAEILANYYYGTTLVIGEKCPETVTYAGAQYETRDYLASALESEMGSSFSAEALKAQAVVLYTYSKYYNFNVSSTGHAYGKTPSSAAYAAVDAVYGYYLSYNGTTALTPFHAISAGKTTSYYNVWGTTAISYLSGGRPSYGDYSAEDFSTTYSITSADLKNLVKSRCNIELTGDPSQWLQIISHDSCIDPNTGYVYSIRVGNEIYTGYKFRSDVMAGTIRSHCFKMVYTPDAAPAGTGG